MKLRLVSAGAVYVRQFTWGRERKLFWIRRCFELGIFAQKGVQFCTQWLISFHLYVSSVDRTHIFGAVCMFWCSAVKAWQSLCESGPMSGVCDVCSPSSGCVSQAQLNWPMNKRWINSVWFFFVLFFVFFVIIIIIRYLTMNRHIQFWLRYLMKLNNFILF